MFLTVLGRKPKISLAELEIIFGAANVTPLSDELALVSSKTIDFSRLGGCLKAGKILEGSLPNYLANLPPGKITLGISDFRPHATAKSSFNEGLKLKNFLRRRHNRSVRLIPNRDGPILSSATSHHNQLGEKLGHLEIAFFHDQTKGPRSESVASLSSQNITAYARRDQARPARDAGTGMLPPKLAQILINLATGPTTTGRLLDPFCGTGTILQESLLMGYSVYGTDLSEKMIKYTKRNLSWLTHKTQLRSPQNLVLEQGNATNFRWKNPIDFVASEIYLGQNFSTPPPTVVLKEVQLTTRTNLLGFLKNLSPQIKPGTPLALAIPAWRRPDQTFACLDIIDEIRKFGYNVHKFKHATPLDLLYYREGQVVARQILVLRKE